MVRFPSFAALFLCPFQPHLPGNALQIGLFTQFAERFKNAEGWTVCEIDAGHDAMITKPEELTELLCA